MKLGTEKLVAAMIRCMISLGKRGPQYRGVSAVTGAGRVKFGSSRCIRMRRRSRFGQRQKSVASQFRCAERRLRKGTLCSVHGDQSERIAWTESADDGAHGVRIGAFV